MEGDREDLIGIDAVTIPVFDRIIHELEALRCCRIYPKSSPAVTFLDKCKVQLPARSAFMVLF